jgi:hypothetical protein
MRVITVNERPVNVEQYRRQSLPHARGIATRRPRGRFPACRAADPKPCNFRARTAQLRA